MCLGITCPFPANAGRFTGNFKKLSPCLEPEWESNKSFLASWDINKKPQEALLLFGNRNIMHSHPKVF